jgi:hypothetical protein
MLKSSFIILYLIFMVTSGAANWASRIQVALNLADWSVAPIIVLLGLPLLLVTSIIGKSTRGASNAQ